MVEGLFQVTGDRNWYQHTGRRSPNGRCVESMERAAGYVSGLRDIQLGRKRSRGKGLG